MANKPRPGTNMAKSAGKTGRDLKRAEPPKTPFELLREKHHLSVESLQQPQSKVLPPLPSGWQDELPPEVRSHLEERPRRARVHLIRGVEALIWFPAAYIEGNYLYYLGETIPLQAHAASRPGNFIIEVVNARPKNIVLRKSLGEDLNKFFFAYITKGIREVRTLGHHDWRVCGHFSILKDNFEGFF